MEVQLVSPEQVLYVGEADDGRRAHARRRRHRVPEDNHAPFLGALADSPVRVMLADGSQEWFAVHGGFVEVGTTR